MFEIEDSIGFLLAKAYQRGYAIFRKPLEEFGLTPKQFSLLAFLWKRDGLSQIELSEKCQIDRTTIGGLLDRLEKQGYIKRSLHPDDRRAYLIRLTESGKSLERELLAIARDVSHIFAEKLTHQEIETLKELLRKLRS